MSKINNLPSGNWALAIAHPGHELRLHGFLEQAKPFVFILTDNSEAKGQDLMWESIKVIDRATKQGITNITPEKLKDPFMRKVLKISLKDGEDKNHVKDSMIEYEVVNRHTDFLNYYVDFMADNLIRFKINYLVCDASEDYHLTHEVVRMLCDLAILRVKQRTGDDIILYDYAVTKPYDSIVHEHCIRVELNDDAVERKLHAVCSYPLGVQELEPDFKMLPDYVNKLRMQKPPRTIGGYLRDILADILFHLRIKRRKLVPEKEQFIFLKNELKARNMNCLKYEYLRPARQMAKTDNYKNFIEPVYGKMLHSQLNEA